MELKPKKFLKNMEDNKTQITIQKRIDDNQKLLIEQLRKTPIVEVACEKVNVGRASYYRWRKICPEFASLADEAMSEGSALINDLAESKLISSISDGNLGAIQFWLRSHHAAYMPKLEISPLRHEQLTEEEQAAIEKALELTGITELVSEQKKEETNENT